MAGSPSRSTTTRVLPNWRWGVVAIEILVPAYVAVVSFLEPASWGEAQFGTYGELYINRNLALAAGVPGAAFGLKSCAAFLATILVPFFTDVVDITAGCARAPDAAPPVLLLVFGVVLVVLPAYGLYWLAANSNR